MAELHGARFTTMLPANPDLEIGADACDRQIRRIQSVCQLHPVQDLERIVGKYTTIYVIG